MGIKDKTITFSTLGTVRLNQDTVKTASDGTFTIKGKAPGDGAVKASFLNDPEDKYKESSDELTYSTGTAPSRIATKLELHEISNVNPGGPITVDGTLTSDPDNVGIKDKTIKFDTSGTIKLIQDTITTDTDGKFTIEGNAPTGQEALIEVKARFDDDNSLYQGSESNVVRYPKESNSAILELDPIAGVDPTAHVPVKGTLSSSDGHEGLAQKSIRLTVTRTSGTSGAISEFCDIQSPKNSPDVEVLSSVVPNPEGVPPGSEPRYTAKTGNDGKFVFDDVGPLCKEGLWDVHAHFDGDSNYGPTSDTEGFSTSDDVTILVVQDIVYKQRADEKEVGIELAIPDPSDLPKGCKLLTDEDHNDKLNEIDIRGTTLNFDSKDKSISKTIEYSIFYDCENPESAKDQMKKEFEEAAGNIMKPDLGVQGPDTILKTCPEGQELVKVPEMDPDNPAGSIEKCQKKQEFEKSTEIMKLPIIDITRPDPPTITAPASSEHITDYDIIKKYPKSTYSFKVMGTAESDSSVTIFDGSNPLETVPAEGGGWTLSGVTLSVGSHILTATAKDQKGKESPPSTSVQIDIVCPNKFYWNSDKKECWSEVQ